jgi:F-box protein 11
VKFQAAHDVERPLNQLRKPARARVWKQICEKLIALLTTPEAPKPAPAPVRTRQDMLHPNATNQPRTHVVESTDGSVSRALRDAQPWDIILVRPGHYEGALVMDKPLEIIGDGSPEDIVIEVTGSNALLCRAPLGMVCNLTLRQLEGGEWFAVDIMTGRLMLLGCRVESDSLGGIAIHGPTAAPRIRHTCVRNCRQSGVTIFDHARGLLEDNEICSNQLSGVVIHSGADPVLRSNRVHSNRHVGIQVDGGQGRLEHNEIFDNGREGVIILNRGNPNMQSNAIHDNTLAGVFVCYSGQGTLEHNNIWSNKQSGIAITSGAQPLVRANRIYANNGKGVWCDPEAAGTVAANDLRGNIFGARWPSETEPHFNQTRFRDNLE